MLPLVSIVVPIYNVEKYVEKCCHSLFGQSYERIEFVFVDDCTTDNSLNVLYNVLSQYPERKEFVKIVHHKINKGVSEARNTGTDVVSGEYLLYVDSDDYLDLNVVEILVAKALEEQADIVVFNVRDIYSDKKSLVERQYVVSDKVSYINNLLIYRINVCVWGKLYKTGIIKKNKIYFPTGLGYGEDYATSPRIAYYAHKVVYCEDCYYNYVKYNDSSYTRLYKSESIDYLIQAISVLYDFFHSKADYNLYEKSLIKARIYVKVKLLIAICIYKKRLWNKLPMVVNLYPDVKCVKIPFFYSLVLFLAEHKLFKLLYIYVYSGYQLKQFFRKKFL